MTSTNFPNGIRGPLHNSAGAATTAIIDLTDNTGGTASLSAKITELNAAQVTAS